jgi:hypothetical protein
MMAGASLLIVYGSTKSVLRIGVCIDSKLKRAEVIGDWIKLNNAKLLNLYFPPSVIRMIKSRRTKWAGHVA